MESEQRIEIMDTVIRTASERGVLKCLGPEDSPLLGEPALRRAEERLGVTLPESYVWFLGRYGSCELNGFELSEVVNVDPDVLLAPSDIVRRNRDEYGFLENGLVLLDEYGECIYYFRMDVSVSSGEYPVWRLVRRGGRIIEDEEFADDFFQFVVKYLTP